MFSRREFLKKCAQLAIAVGAGPFIAKDIANAFQRIADDDVKVIFLQGQSCAGCSISLLYGDSPELIYALTKIIDTQFHPNISAAQGEMVIDIINQNEKKGNYYLVIEGSIPDKMREACLFGEESFYDAAVRCMKNASAIIAMGTCASWGGIPASNMNPTGAKSVPEVMKKENINKLFIRVPGCPVHPDRFLGTVAYIIAYGKLPPIDKQNKPIKYFGKNLKIHDNCDRFQYFVQDKYIINYNTKQGCLLKKGCRGPITYADCPFRKWNMGTSVCIHSNAPCIGCVNEDFPYQPAHPLYTSPSEIT